MLFWFVFMRTLFDHVRTAPRSFGRGHRSTSCMCHETLTFSLLWQDAAVHSVLYALLFSPSQQAARLEGKKLKKPRYSVYVKVATSAVPPLHKVKNYTACPSVSRSWLWAAPKCFPCSCTVSSAEPCPVLIKDQSGSPRSGPCCRGRGKLLFWGRELQTSLSHCPDARRNLGAAVCRKPVMCKM